jgi:hypothetical protein
MAERDVRKAAVTFVGTILSVDEQQSATTYVIDDGSAQVSVKKWQHSDNQMMAEYERARALQLRYNFLSHATQFTQKRTILVSNSFRLSRCWNTLFAKNSRSIGQSSVVGRVIVLVRNRNQIAAKRRKAAETVAELPRTIEVLAPLEKVKQQPASKHPYCKKGKYTPGRPAHVVVSVATHKWSRPIHFVRTSHLI